MSGNTQVADRTYTSPFVNDFVETQPSSIVPMQQAGTALAKPVTPLQPIKERNPRLESAKKMAGPVRLPILVEAAIAFSWAAIVVTGAIAVLVTFRSRSSGLEFFLRSGTVTIVAGVLLLLFAWIVVRGSYEIMLKERKEAEEAEKAKQAEELEKARLLEEADDLEGTEAEIPWELSGEMGMPGAIESEGNQTEAEL